MIHLLRTSVHEMVPSGEPGPGGGRICGGFTGFPARTLNHPRGHRVGTEFRTTPTINTLSHFPSAELQTHGTSRTWAGAAWPAASPGR